MQNILPVLCFIAGFAMAWLLLRGRVDETRQKLSDAFTALSADALAKNNRAFLELARATLGQTQETARGDLELRQQAIAAMVTPMRASLDKVDTRIQELEKARAGAYAALQASPVTTQLAQEVLQNILYNPQRKTLSPERIAETVARYYGVPIDELKGRARDKQIVLPRQIAMYLMREETEAPLLRIGEVLGGRDHSTVLHGCEKIEREMAENDEFRRDVGALREMLYTD